MRGRAWNVMRVVSLLIAAAAITAWIIALVVLA